MSKGPPPDRAEELRALIREANGVLGDLRREKREIQQLVTGGVRDALKETVHQEVAALRKELQAVQEHAKTTILRKMDEYAKMVLGDEGISGYQGMMALVHERAQRLGVDDNPKYVGQIQQASEIYEAIVGRTGLPVANLPAAPDPFGGTARGDANDPPASG